MASERDSQEPGTSCEPGQSGSNSDAEDKKGGDGRFECNICLDTAQDAVVSMCGHLFCWPCLHQWLQTRPNRQVCPVCKSAISREKVIPLYGRGSDQKDPRDKAPPRPQGQRSEPTNTGFPGLNLGGDGGGFHMSFGIGAFPFTFLTSTFSFGDDRPGQPNPGSVQHEEEQWLSKLFLYVALIFVFWLLVA